MSVLCAAETMSVKVDNRGFEVFRLRLFRKLLGSKIDDPPKTHQRLKENIRERKLRGA